MRVSTVTGQDRQQQRAQNVALARSVVASIFQRALSHPAVEHAGRGQELRKEHQLPVRRGRCALVPAHVHAPAQRVHHHRLVDPARSGQLGPFALAS